MHALPTLSFIVCIVQFNIIYSLTDSAGNCNMYNYRSHEVRRLWHLWDSRFISMGIKKVQNPLLPFCSLLFSSHTNIHNYIYHELLCYTQVNLCLSFTHISGPIIPHSDQNLNLYATSVCMYIRISCNVFG